MSHIRRRPDLWSYLSFSRPSSRNDNMSTLPLRGNFDDPFEKPGRRYPSPFSAGDGYYNDSRPSWRNPTARARYLKIGGAIAAILLFVYVLIPGERARSDVIEKVILPETTPAGGGQRVSDPEAATTKCTQSISPSKPLVQYALMVDAGSTGSRIHVYKFNNCGATPELENEVFEMTAKKEGGSGLSAYPTDPLAAAKSLDVLMDVAMANVPETYRSCSPIAVKATAGLRKLGPERSEQILTAVRNHLTSVYPFPIVAEDRGGVEVMDGKDEGVYAWITTNYLLHKIGSSDKSPTAAVFDLGGGSTQIVFEPTFPLAPNGGMPEIMADGDHKYELKFGGRNFSLYQHSYLGYGLMAARENLHQVVVLDAYAKNPDAKAWVKPSPLVNPCIAPGMTRDVEVVLPAEHLLGEKISVTMTGPSTGMPSECLALARRTLHKEAECMLAPCAFNGVFQPSLSTTFAREDIYLFSYFYDRMQPLGLPEAPKSFTLNDIKSITDDVCGGRANWSAFEKVPGATAELEDRPEHCLDLSFMLALLNTGYDISMEREVRIAKKIDENELGWCLGASLPLLSKESGWECKLQDVTI